MTTKPHDLSSIDQLVAPIDNTHQGVGEDLTFDLRLDAIVAARTEDDPLLAQGDWVTDLKVADWDFVKAQCAELLTTTSKDLKIALWYVDALSHTDHLTGINHGLALLEALNDQYWLTMHPPLDGDDDSMDIRAGLLSWFVKTLSDDLKQLPLADSEQGSYNYNHFLSAREHDKQRQQNHEVDSGLSLSDYHHAIKHSQSTWQQTLLSALETTRVRWQALTDQLNDLMGMDAPVFAPVTELLETLTQHLSPLIPQYTAPQAEQNVAVDQADESGNMPMSPTPNNAAVMSGFNPQNRDHVANRQHALKQMAQIQDYFAINEPHSPVTFLLGRAIEWADMPLDQWLARVIKSEDQLALLSDMIGIKPAAPHQDSDY